MSELKAGAVYKNDFDDILLAIIDGVNFNAVIIVRSEQNETVEVGETVLFTSVSAEDAFADLRRPTKVADSLAEYYERKQ